MAYDRNEVLERTDLRELADQLAGPHKGRGAGATWPCPDPGHGNQTGRTPPVSIFRTAYGDERWRCHSCGAGGTAIDLVMTTQAVRFPEALELLAQHAGVAAVDRPVPRLRSAHIERPATTPLGRPNPELERFVAAAEAHLWSEQGRPMQRWLAERGLGEDVLRANRVGADPGPARLERTRGLPRGGPAIVLPVLGADGLATYLQARYLHPEGHKYDNPSAALAGPLPRAAEVRSSRPPVDPNLVLVTEGIPDALVGAQAGYRSVAVLGAGAPDERAAITLAERFPHERLVLAFDADGPGRAGAERLQELLSDRGCGPRVVRVEVPESAGDLNGWQQLAGAAFGEQLSRALTETSDRERAMATDRPQNLGDGRPAQVVMSPAEVERYLGSHPEFAARVASRARELADLHGLSPQRQETVTVEGDGRETLTPHATQGGALVDPLAVVPIPGPNGEDYVAITRQGGGPPKGAGPAQPLLEQRLEVLYYSHLLLDEPGQVAANLARIEQAVASWTDPGLAHATAALSDAPEMAALDSRLDEIYRVAAVDPPLSHRVDLEVVRSTVGSWSAELRHSSADRPGIETSIAPQAEPPLAAGQRWAFNHGLCPTPTLDPGTPEPAGLDAVALDL